MDAETYNMLNELIHHEIGHYVAAKMRGLAVQFVYLGSLDDLQNLDLMINLGYVRVQRCEDPLVNQFFLYAGPWAEARLRQEAGEHFGDALTNALASEALYYDDYYDSLPYGIEQQWAKELEPQWDEIKRLSAQLLTEYVDAGCQAVRWVEFL